MNKKTILFKAIEDKTITWFENSNQYLILENTTADILSQLKNGISKNKIAKNLSENLGIPNQEALDFIENLEENLINNKSKEKSKNSDFKNITKPKNYKFIKFYKVNNIIFKVAYLSEKELALVHLKFEHLSIEKTDQYQNKFEVFIDGNFIFLVVNNIVIGRWTNEDVHFFQGKFSMEFIQKIHQKEEKEWLGVFHASAVSDGKKSILFLGDSGNGKSTSLALLQANGFTCLADDFVPVDANKQEVYSFPASISIKKNSLATLLPLYPELENTTEHHLTRLNKVVRYLKPNNSDYTQHLHCKDLVFIKYEKDSDLQVNKIAKLEAFQQLVPDSWLSPIKENAQLFLNWFATLNCYQITYSDNKNMINTVSKIFKNEL